MVVFLLLLLLLPVSAQAITADELRELSDVWESSERERSERIETGNLNKLIPKKPEKKMIPLEVKKEEAKEAEKPEKQEKIIVKEPPQKLAPIVKKKEVPVIPIMTPRKVRQKSRPKPKVKKYQMKAEEVESIEEDHSFIAAPEVEAAPLPGLLPSFPSQMFKQNTDGKYFPPPRQGGFEALTDAVRPDKRRVFGIRIGTWIEGELKRPATNSEPGLIEIYTTEAIIGKKRTMPSGTTFFAQKAYNAGTKKLDLIVEKGITPNGIEFQIRGLVFDLKRTAGLIGIVTTDRNMIVERSTSKGFIAAGGAVVKNLAGDTVIGAAGTAAAESLLGDSSDVIEATKKLKQTIRSSPQALLIRVEETF